MPVEVNNLGQYYRFYYGFKKYDVFSKVLKEIEQIQIKTSEFGIAIIKSLLI